MFPLMIPMLIGAAGGALTSKDKLKGALLGAGLGAAGGALAPGAGGLLGGAETAATYGTGLGTQQTAMLAAQDAGMGGGLLGQIKELAPIAQAAGTGIQTAQSLMPQHQPVVPGQLRGGSFDASGLIGQNNAQLQALQQKRLQRRGMA